MWFMIVRHTHSREEKPRAGKTYARTRGKPSCGWVYLTHTVLHIMIDVHRLYVPLWLLGAVGADLRPDNDAALAYTLRNTIFIIIHRTTCIRFFH
jgi:hypothetical protein